MASTSLSKYKKDLPYDGEDDNGEAVEYCTASRYVRFTEMLGKDKLKQIYRAVDTELGIEVAWNIIQLDQFTLERAHILEQMQLFKEVQHRNIIEFFAFWEEESKRQLVFISELFPSGTLLQYIEKSPPVRLRLIKTWCKQILVGIQYLHAGTPPLIHRNINCANIFLEAVDVKIGLLGLETFEGDNGDNPTMLPHYMAPEYFSSHYSIGIDIWAFGMTLLEMITKREPYSECSTICEVHQKIIERKNPIQLDTIQDQEVKEFIKLCFLHDSVRPTASELLQHRFFEPNEKDSLPVSINKSILMIEDAPLKLQRQSLPYPSKETTKEKEISKAVNGHGQSDPIKNVNVSVLDIKSKNAVRISLQIQTEHETSEIDFEYNLETDVADTVATDMCAELGLTGSDKIREIIQDQVEMLGVADNTKSSQDRDQESEKEEEKGLSVPRLIQSRSFATLPKAQPFVEISPRTISTPTVTRSYNKRANTKSPMKKEQKSSGGASLSKIYKENREDFESLEVSHSLHVSSVGSTNSFKQYEDLLDSSSEQLEEEGEEEGGEGKGETPKVYQTLKAKHLQEEKLLLFRQQKELNDLYHKLQQERDHSPDLQYSTSSDNM